MVSPVRAAGAVAVVGILAGTMYAVPSEWQLGGSIPVQVEAEAPPVRSRETPVPLYGIYMSQCVVGTPSFRDKLVALIDETPLNAVVIDIKDYTGRISFQADNPVLADSVSTACGARDMKSFIALLHEKDIYVIGRITVFQDPYYTAKHPEAAVQSASLRPGEPWRDHKGLSFIDVSHRPYWEYVVELSKVAHTEFGFDELNYDYIRYPSDGPMSDARYVNPNKAEAVELFWAYLHERVKPVGVTMSADLFGMTTTNTDDLNIGQQLERALPHFDYIMPMVYPSHYPKNYLNLADPNMDPRGVVFHAMSEAARRVVATTTVVRTLGGESVPGAENLFTKSSFPTSVLRPWLQDFDYGKDYTAADIDAQIQATREAGLTSWVFWDAGNKYEALRDYYARGVDR